jgi:hypothetical protein
MNFSEFNINNSIYVEDIFENYKIIDGDKKTDLINSLLLRINSGDIKYQILLNIICRYESVESIEKLLAYVNHKYNKH